MTKPVLTKRFLQEVDLTAAPVFTVVWDKFGVRYFKLADGTWASNDLATLTCKSLVAKRVRHYEG